MKFNRSAVSPQPRIRESRGRLDTSAEMRGRFGATTTISDERRGKSRELSLRRLPSSNFMHAGLDKVRAMRDKLPQQMQMAQ